MDIDSSKATYTSVSYHSNGDQLSHSPEVHGEESEKLYEYSGHIPSAEVAAVPEELGSSADIPTVDGNGVTLITQTIVSVTPPNPSLEAELSSSEIMTFVPDSGALPNASTQEDLEEVDSFPTTTHSDMNKSEHDTGEGSVGSSGDTEEEATSAILPAAYHPEDQDVTTTLNPHQTLTEDWKPESYFSSSSSSASLSASPFTILPSSAFGGSQHVYDSSTEKPSTVGSEHISKGRHAEVTTRNIRSCKLETNISKLLYFFLFHFHHLFL